MRRSTRSSYWSRRKQYSFEEDEPSLTGGEWLSLSSAAIGASISYLEEQLSQAIQIGVAEAQRSLGLKLFNLDDILELESRIELELLRRLGSISR